MSETGAARPEAIEAIVLATTTSESKKSGKTRKVTFEIPSEGPNPFEGMGGERIHLVVVKLNNDETPIQEPAQAERQKAHERKAFTDLRPTAQAALCCKEPQFWAFLEDENALPKHLRTIHDSDDAAEAVRFLLGVGSRSEFNTDTAAADRWRAFEARYWTWKHGGR